MKKTISILTLALLFLAGNLFAQENTAVKNQFKKGNTNQVGFIDADGDGYNDNAADHDGDGIPNGMDDDYTGAKSRKGNKSRGFVDLDGDGINDNALDADGDGIPNGRDDDFVRTQDGTGSMRGSMNGSGSGTADCDGTGSNSKGNKRGGKR
jgi:hypothetical protein